jgi:hypothetical protein
MSHAGVNCHSSVIGTWHVEQVLHVHGVRVQFPELVDYLYPRLTRSIPHVTPSRPS